MNIAQVAGMAAEMCIEFNYQSRELQRALLSDVQAPATIVPLFNLLPSHPDWFTKQLYYLDNQYNYSVNENYLDTSFLKYSYGSTNAVRLRNNNYFQGVFQRIRQQDYRFKIISPNVIKGYIYQLVTLYLAIENYLKPMQDRVYTNIYGRINHAGSWLLVEHISNKSSKIL